MKTNLKKTNLRSAVSFVEIMLAFLILAMVFLPIFKFLTSSVKETETFYTETVAICRAKFIMDTLMFQMPWRVIREGNPCGFKYPQVKSNTGSRRQDNLKTKDYIEKFMDEAISSMLGSGYVTATSNVYKGDGIYTDRKGFKYRARIKVIDLDYDSTGNPITLMIGKDIISSGDNHNFTIKELVPKDDDGKYNLIKKIIVEVKWSNIKGKDPKDDPGAKKLFLVGFKSNLEG